MNIYGHEVDLITPDNGDYVTDVMVLARVVSHDGERLQGSLLISEAEQTDSIIQSGMLTAAQAIINSGWVSAGDDD